MHAIALFALLHCAPPIFAGGARVDFASLLAELTDRRALARLPDPAYVCRQASSYDRKSTVPGEGWFANGDCGQFLRVEAHGERSESVMLDVEGPGAIVRIWSANPAGTLRVYLDGAAEPVLAEDMTKLLTGTGPVEAPLAQKTSGGCTLWLPIPYARACRITCDAPKDLYYHVEHRVYPAGTEVATFEAADLARRAHEIGRVNSLWSHPGAGVDAPGPVAFTFSLGRNNPGGALACLDPEAQAGPHAITELHFRVESPDLETALRRAILRLTFDGEETVTCPLGDFFASAPGVYPYSSWPAAVARGVDAPVGRPEAQVELVARWVMPYRERFDLRIDNRGAADLHVAGLVRTQPWTFDDRSLHFFARWRASGPMKTRPMRDWTHVAIEGRGLLVGDMLSIANPVRAWWGEGDEKIYVDGETFPAHFGTGTEDYYGYAWSSPRLFQAPLHAQTRCDGPGTFGLTCVNRFRALDAIPFETSLRFDMELWHWADCTVEMAATTFFYARPGAKDDAPAIRAEDLAVPKLVWKPFQVEGAIEAETLAIAAISPGVTHEAQPLDDGNAGGWSNGLQLWVRAKQIGDFVELRVPVEHPGRREVIVYPTRSWDYGTLQFSVDGRKAGLPVPTFNTEARAIGTPKPVSLGVFDLGSEMLLRVEVVGTHERAEPPRTYFGLDCVVVR